MRKWKRLVVVTLCLLVVGLGTPAYVKADTLSSTQKIEEVIKLLDRYYLNGVKEEELIDAAIRGMVYSLGDPYTDYFNAEESNQFMDYLEGSYYETGFYYEFLGKRVRITEVLPGSPAEQAGLKSGAYIRSVGGVEVNNETFETVLYRAMSTNEGLVTLTVSQGSKVATYTMQCEKYYEKQVASGLFQDKTGIIELSAFNQQALAEFDDVLKELQNKQMHSLILDLRDNGGGDVDIAREIASRFITEGIFFYVRDNNNKEHQEVISGGSTIGIPVYVLVNEYTASAAEMLAGALQDHGVATVIGTPTYGKGVMQQLIGLESEAMLKLTTHEYYTPKHHQVNEIGIIPDIEKEDQLAQIFAALWLAGSKSFDVKLEKDSYAINGISFYGELPVIRDKGKVYIPSRLAAAVLDGSVEWRGGKQQAVVINREGKGTTYPISNGSAKLSESLSYVDVEQLSTQYPGFTWLDNLGTLSLHYVK